MKKEDKSHLETKLMMMLATSILLIVIATTVVVTTLSIKNAYTFKFPEITLYVKAKGSQQYDLDKLYDNMNMLLQSTSKNEIKKVSEKILYHKEYNKLMPKIVEFFEKESFEEKTNIEILNITKIYGSTKKLKGNNDMYDKTASKYRVSLKLERFTKSKYITITIILNPSFKITQFIYEDNEQLKEFYEAENLSKILTIKSLSEYLTPKLKNKILIRNILVKPTTTKFKIGKVIYVKEQNQIHTIIDNKKYIMVYKKGEIIDVIENKNQD